jgi:hypothetical protein
MPGEIKRLEIFGAGTWAPASGGKVTVTESHLDEIVQSFGELQGTNIVKPHLKLGHTDAQKWFGQKVGVPTLGWIDRVWREGAKLFADISSVPEALLEMIKQGRYHNVSAEVYAPGQVESNGKTFGHVLSAVAILGTEMPAVRDLAGLAAALYENQFTAGNMPPPTTYSKGMHTSMFTQEQVDSLIAAAVLRAVTAKAGEFSAQITDLTTQVGVLTQRAEGAESKVAEQAASFANTQATALIDAAIKDGRLLPKQKDMALAFMTGIKAPISFGGKEQSPAQLFSDFLATFGKQVDLTERGNGKEGSRGPTNFATAAQELDHVVKQVVSKSGGKLDYATAMSQVIHDPEHLDLANRYAQGA